MLRTARGLVRREARADGNPRDARVVRLFLDALRYDDEHLAHGFRCRRSRRRPRRREADSRQRDPRRRQFSRLRQRRRHRQLRSSKQ